jgi:SAM-dependent methyltransferase
MTSGPAGTWGPKELLNAVHNRVVFNRRVRVLSRQLAKVIPSGGSVLDLGCGDGSIALALMRARGDLAIEGVDVLIRPTTLIPVTKFDGDVLPFEADSFDYVTIIDVLHHTDDPASVLSEACRVARQGVVIKDHLLEGMAAGVTLRLMDWVGNRGHDVVLPFNYLTRARWDEALRRSRLKIVSWEEKLGLYPFPARLIFERHLHFIALAAPEKTTASRR